MRLLDWLLLAAHSLASAIDGTTDDRHLTTDPACMRHVAVRPGSRLDRASRGVSCTPCMVVRAFGREPAEASSATLEEAIAAAKVRAGLDPALKHPVFMFHQQIEEAWRARFWEELVGRAGSAFMMAAAEINARETWNGLNPAAARDE